MKDTGLGRYDTETQMFVETAHDLDIETLRFWKWLASQPTLADDRDPSNA